MRERNPVHRGWLYAIMVAQEKGDLAPLAQLLPHKEFDLGRGERLTLAMLFDRFRLAKKPGGQRTPIGKLSERDKLEIMAKDVRDIEAGHAAMMQPKADAAPAPLPPALAEQLKGLRLVDVNQLRVVPFECLEEPRRMSRKEAIEKVSGFYGSDADRLRDFLDGKRADTRPRGRKKKTTRT